MLSSVLFTWPQQRGYSATALRLYAFLCLLLAALWLAFANGAIPISLWQLWQSDDLLQRTVFWEIRAPRVVLAALVGATLAMAGAALQGLFRNPLADPGLIGVSSGAALGAVAMIVIDTSIAVNPLLLPYLVPAAAMLGAIAVTVFLYLFAGRFGNFNTTTMLLAGIAINSLAVVGVGVFQYLSDDNQLRTLTFWLLGSFSRASWVNIAPVAAVMAIALCIVYRQRRALDIMQLGEHTAQQTGIDVGRVKRRLVICTALAVGAAVAVSGMINFVGLVVPHLTRLIGIANHRYVLPASALLGAALAVVADLIARTIAVPAEIPVGLVTSAIGAPFFLFLIAQTRTP